MQEEVRTAKSPGKAGGFKVVDRSKRLFQNLAGVYTGNRLFQIKIQCAAILREEPAVIRQNSGHSPGSLICVPTP
jgi:hypothetical protein